MRIISAVLALSALTAAPFAVATAQGSGARAPVAASTSAPPSATGVAATDDPDQRVRCRSIQITGSLVRRERVCRTVGEWRRLAERGNDNARATQERVGQICAGTCGGGR